MSDPGQTERATMRDVALRAGVSIQTVSNFLNQRHRPRRATQVAIERAIRELNYRPNASARSLRSQRSRSLVLALEDPNQLGLHDPLHMEFLHGAAAAAHAADYALVVEVTPTAEVGEAALRLVREGRVDGAILSVGELSSDYRRSISAMVDLQAPVVLLQQNATLPRVSSVMANDERGAAEAVSYLASLGHRSIAWLGAEPLWPGPRRRHAGVAKACADLGLGLVEWTADAYTVEAARAAVSAQLKASDRPTAVVAVNDIVALGVVQQAIHSGISVPGDLSVVGFNDFDFATWVQPGITTVRLPSAQMAVRAIDLVINAVEDPARPAETVAFEVELVVRGTTGPAAT